MREELVGFALIKRVPRGGMLADARRQGGVDACIAQCMKVLQQDVGFALIKGKMKCARGIGWICPDQGQDGMCERDWLDLP